jgi:hypothetical protein
MRRSLTLAVTCLMCTAIVAMGALFGGRSLVAVTSAAGDVGYQDQSFPANPDYSEFAPTGEKPQSKLWFNDGRWWASMLHSDGKYYIFYLDLNTQTWVKTNTPLDDRIATQADCLWDGTHLYVASGAGSKGGGTGGEPGGVNLDARLYRYSYNAGNPPATAYSLDAGFPVMVRNGGAETIVIDKDTTGQLWITYTQNNKVWINRSLGADNLWNPSASPSQTAPFNPPPVPGHPSSSSVGQDDISSLIAFDGKIGVLWSNQSDKDYFYFAYHNDADADSTWQSGVAWQRTNVADDHINLKSLSTTAGGDLFAVVKTSLGGGASNPRIVVLHRKPDGSWDPPAAVWNNDDGHTRAILMVDSLRRRLYVFAPTTTTGGLIVYKQSNDYTSGPVSFPSAEVPFMEFAGLDWLNNPTSTKQNIDGTNGIDSIVVLACDEFARIYAHNVLPLNGPLPPTNTPGPSTSTPTNTPTNTSTSTPTSTPTNTPTSTATNTQLATSTPTSTPTNTPTSTPTNTLTSTATPQSSPNPKLFLPFVIR